MEKRTLSVFKYSNYLPFQKSEKTNEPFPRKMPNGRRDRRIDNGDFIGPSEEGSKKNYFKQFFACFKILLKPSVYP